MNWFYRAGDWVLNSKHGSGVVTGVAWAAWFSWAAWVRYHPQPALETPAHCPTCVCEDSER